MPTPEEFEAAGLYDPAAADAAEQLALLEVLIEYGLTVERLVELTTEGHGLFALAARRIVEGGAESLKLADAAARAGLGVDDARQAWRAYGFTDPTGDRLFTELDVDALALFRVMAEVFGRPTALQIARTIGASMARLADAETGATRSALVAPVRAAGGSDVEVARTFAEATKVLMPLLTRGMDACTGTTSCWRDRAGAFGACAQRGEHHRHRDRIRRPGGLYPPQRGDSDDRARPARARRRAAGHRDPGPPERPTGQADR